MKRLILIVAAFVSAICAEARVTVPASDGRITYVGRTLVSGGDVSFDWSGVNIRVAFTGGYLALNAGDSRRNYYNLWIDREPSADPDVVFQVGSDTTIVLFNVKEKKPQKHFVTIQRRTEGNQGRSVFHGFALDGELLDAGGLKPRVIEVVGDSYTCGYGAENSVRTDPFRPEDETPAKTYADILGRYFGADVVRIAHSGQGIARNYNDGGRGIFMPDRYLMTFDMSKEGDPAWDFSRIRPSVTMIYLGTNDFSTKRQPTMDEFCKNYKQLVDSILKAYGDNYPVLCIAAQHSEWHHLYVREAVRRIAKPNVRYVGLPVGVHNNESDLGASWHPNYQGHLKKAYAILPALATLTGWPLEDKPLR